MLDHSRGSALPRITTSAEVLDLSKRLLSPATRIAFPDVVVSGGQGAYFWDLEGRRYLDLHSMAAIMNIGYGHPRYVEALVTQAKQFVHCNPAYTVHETPVRLAARLVELTPGTFDKRVSFGLSGSDSVDGAIKLARAATGREKIVTFAGAYHGCTYGALSVSSASPAMSAGFGPVLPGVLTLEFPRATQDDASQPEPLQPDPATPRRLAELEALLQRFPGEVAALIIEPVQGDSGVLVPAAGYLGGVAHLAERYGFLTIADEVQTGIGRTGTLFASEHFGFVPDIMVLGKALGGGMPISAIVARSELMDSWGPPGHVFSTSANPVAAAAALTVIDIVEDEDLVERSRVTGLHLRRRLAELRRSSGLLGQVRGEGLMTGVDLVSGSEDPLRNRVLAAKVIKFCFDHGCFVTFLAGSVLRFVPPLVISIDEIDEGLAVVARALQAVDAGQIDDDEVTGLTGW